MLFVMFVGYISNCRALLYICVIATKFHHCMVIFVSVETKQNKSFFLIFHTVSNGFLIYILEFPHGTVKEKLPLNKHRRLTDLKLLQERRENAFSSTETEGSRVSTGVN